MICHKLDVCDINARFGQLFHSLVSVAQILHKNLGIETAIFLPSTALLQVPSLYPRALFLTHKLQSSLLVYSPCSAQCTLAFNVRTRLRQIPTCCVTANALGHYASHNLTLATRIRPVVQRGGM
jgi:hypothetical protein